MRTQLRFAMAFSFALAACGGDDGKCDFVAQSGCDDGEVCEQVIDGEPTCFKPVEVHGRVFDLDSNAGIGDARVVAVDVNSAAISGVSVSEAPDGKYVLQVPALRASDGTPSALSATLRADAQGYLGFPGTVRQALPVDIATAVKNDDGVFVLQSAVTDIGLLADAAAGTARLEGNVEMPDDGHGVLVVAESAGKGFSAIASRDGDYAILNLQPGTYTVTAYSVDHVYEVATLDVAANASTAQNLKLTADAAATLNGSVSIVNGGQGTGTSVLAFIESTFDPVTGRGVPPPGLRAPAIGVAPNISGAFTLAGLPPGNYVIVAGFENDFLVRDPDHCISGTADVHVTLAAGATVDAPTTFKITGSLDIMSPGASTAEPITGNPTFTWADDSSEDQYVIELFDAFGQQVWTKTIPGFSGGIPTVTYDGGALASGMFYQWRATSTRTTGGGGEQCEIARTEDLKGVFFVP